MAVPVLTNEQRIAASAKAVEVRTKRAELRRQLKESKVSFAEVLSVADSDAIVSGDINSLPYWKAMLKQSRDRIRIAEKRVKLLEDAYSALRNADEAKATM